MIRTTAALLVLSLTLVPAAFTTDDLPPHTSLVYPGVDGGLAYTVFGGGNRIPDYSHAGYGGGGVAIPYVPAVDTLWAVEGDASPMLQAAIDRISELPLDKNGFRGALMLMHGRYELHSPVRVSASGVVIRGEGMGDTGTVLVGRTTEAMREGDATIRNTRLLVIAGEEGIEEHPGRAVAITDDYVPFGAYTFNVASTAGLETGDTVIVRRHANREYFEALELDIDNDKWGYGGERWSHDFDRVITAIHGTTVTVDAPITCPVETRWGGGEVIPYTDHRISRSGIENLRGVSEYNPEKRTTRVTNMNRDGFYTDEYYNDEQHYGTFIGMDNLTNGWVRNVTQLHFGRSLVAVGSGCKWMTVQDCESWRPVAMRSGSRRFIYSISGQLCLVQRCTSDLGRHSFVMEGRLTTGPNVFLDCTATRPYSTSEPHSDLVAGALYDNVIAPIALRYAASNPQRWMSVWGVLWNCEGMFRCQKPPVGQHFAFGQIGIHAVVFNTNLVDHRFPNGHIESWDEHVAPRSLYLTQLADRLGPAAVKSIAVPAQLTDPSDKSWGGNMEGVLR